MTEAQKQFVDEYERRRAAAQRTGRPYWRIGQCRERLRLAQRARGYSRFADEITDQTLIEWALAPPR